MKIRTIIKIILLSILFLRTGSLIEAAESDKLFLQNEKLKVEFNNEGLVNIHDISMSKTIKFTDEGFSISIGDVKINSKNLKPEVSKDDSSITYVYNKEQYMIKAVYELKPAWRFLSKQLFIISPNGADYDVNDVQAFYAKLENQTESVNRLSGGRYGVSIRLADPNNSTTEKADYGIFMLLQNPFNIYEQQEQKISLSYKPDMAWKSEYGAFASDRICIGTYKLTGTQYPERILPEWQYIQKPDEFIKRGPLVDIAEIDAVTECIRAFLLVNPKKSIRVHVGWCENDYQIDVNKPEGVTEYKRIIDRAAEMGCGYVLYTPAHSGLAPLSENRDAWGWENLLWLNLGQKIRKDEWNPSKDTIPNSLQEMLDYAKSKDIKLLGYVYPTLPFMQNPEWTNWISKINAKPGGYLGADTGIRSFQDWLVNKLVEFAKKTGAGGYSFDHWWIAYNDASSKYAQWYGCRRILENLRRRIPDIVIDGRQQYHGFGPWTWIAGSYPHPMASDEQPGSFAAFKDLHTDRISADRQRYIAWWFRMKQFCPVEILPGFITHQTQRTDAQRRLHRDSFRIRDWDYLGWKYSLLSSIATAPFNHVVNMIPARDEQEFKYFSEEDKKWFRDWLDFSDKNIEYMRNVRPIIGQPMVGRVDGTSAIVEDKGFVFLFNPNYRKLNAEFTLDASIGLTKGNSFLIKELYPQDGKFISHKEICIFNYGDKVSVAMDGASAKVLEIKSAPDSIAEPILFNCTGKASIKEKHLELSDFCGESGAETEVIVLMPNDTQIKSVTINGKEASFNQKSNIIYIRIQFAGTYFSKCQQIGTYDPNFTDTNFSASFTIPKRIFEQLENRKKAWPISYTEDDLLAPWLDPSRLLLFVCIAEPDDQHQVKILIDGKEMEPKKAYNGVYPYVGKHTYIGIYADISNLKPDIKHQVEVTLPQALKPGQFQGLFLENIETEYTSGILIK